MSLSLLRRRAAVLRSMVAGFLILLTATIPFGFGQTELATVFGRVTDQSGAVISGAEVEIRNVETNSASIATSNSDGLYSSPSLHPGRYVISVRKPGFRTVSATGLELNVQDNVVRNFTLQVGSASESVTVTADASKINTTDATVSTVVDRNFAENLPMNGRSFQTLIQLTPGVVLTPSTAADSGQFSVNGQRASANYWMVDGVGANIGLAPTDVSGNGLGGALASFSVQGGTNGLVSVDAMQEFRIQTSTYAPEFGRTPGAQISILTRSGTNQFHGTAFDYFRNDALDANDWFADRDVLPKPRERQNDFGGTLGGPILRNKTFFFFSYEGLRLRLPQVVETTVPSLDARQSAIAVMQPYLNAYPLPTGADLGDGTAPMNASFANRSTLNAYSIRIDHRFNDKVNIFGRYNYAPSAIVQRAPSGSPLSTVEPAQLRTDTATLGATWTISPTMANDLRFNYSKTGSSSSFVVDNFGGAAPLPPLSFPNPFTSENSRFVFDIFSLSNGLLFQNPPRRNKQRQVNLVDNISVQKGSHSLRFGTDFRRLSPVIQGNPYTQGVFFLDMPSSENGEVFFSFVQSVINPALLFRNLGLFAQDTWRIRPRLTMTYGVRWDVDFAPTSTSGPHMAAVINTDNPSSLALAPPGTPAFNTPYRNVAPRIGVAYQLNQAPDRQTVIRGGFGVFYDLATQEAGNGVFGAAYPFGAEQDNFGGTFPLDATTAAPPPVTPGGTLFAFNPHLQLPYTLQWNVALEQALGREQTLSASYVGSTGRRLIQTTAISDPNPTFSLARLIGNTATSDYDALQLQFQRQLSHGLQGLASYSWSHSIDTASAGSYGNASNVLVPGISSNVNRGPSTFDVRNAVTAGFTYAIPGLRGNAFASAVLGGWSVQNVVQVRSAAPVDIFDSTFSQLLGGSAHVRPDIVPGKALYLYGSQYPGGKAINAGAFVDPPTDGQGHPLRQGNLGRDALRAFGAAQWDWALHRDFPIHESVKLQFRAEMFNLLNHPNFGPPIADLSNKTQFGQSTQMLGRSLDQDTGGGSFSSLYQIGGPRSIQLALKLLF
jgi:hypothetical protein